MTRLACHYCVLRFRPHPETGEFVNIGVILICPQAGYFGYRCEKKRYRRATQFFPELEPSFFKAAVEVVRTELDRFYKMSRKDFFGENSQPVDLITLFRELTRVREDIVAFGQPGSLLADDPEEALATLHARYVERQFAGTKEYREAMLSRQIGQKLKLWYLSQRYQKGFTLGDDRFHVRVPFAHAMEGHATAAIKPLSLIREDATSVYQHGDQWLTNVRRLREFGHLPERMVFPVELPAEGLQLEAANEIVRELCEQNVQVINIVDEAELHAAVIV